MKNLTIIIPFLNEGDEIMNTVESILKNSNNDVDLILIDDNSDDNYDYQSIESIYGIKYFGLEESNEGKLTINNFKIKKL